MSSDSESHDLSSHVKAKGNGKKPAVPTPKRDQKQPGNIMMRIKCLTCGTERLMKQKNLGVDRSEDGFVTLVKLPRGKPLRCKKCQKIFRMEVNKNGNV